MYKEFESIKYIDCLGSFELKLGLRYINLHKREERILIIFSTAFNINGKFKWEIK